MTADSPELHQLVARMDALASCIEALDERSADLTAQLHQLQQQVAKLQAAVEQVGSRFPPPFGMRYR